MAELRYVGDSWTQVGPEELFVTPGQEVDLPLGEKEISELLATGDWKQLDAPEPGDPDQPWGPGAVRAFLSHKADYKVAAAGIKDALSLYGIAAFVAHEDITPTAEWQDVILRALETMDLMIPLLTPDFRQSDWTGQEVGYAVARGVPVIPVRHGSDPFGFIGRYQAMNWQGDACGDLAARIFELLLDSEEPTLHGLGTDAYVSAVSNARSFKEANRLAPYLPRITALSVGQLGALELAVRYEVETDPGRADGGPSITGPDDVRKLLGEEMGALCQEQVRVLLLDRRNRVVGQRVIYQGNAYSSVIRPAEVLRPAVVEGVPHLIVAHNHPSADPSPSPQDIRVTRELREAAELLGLSLLDHVVIGGDEAVSFKDRGLLD